MFEFECLVREKNEFIVTNHGTLKAAYSLHKVITFQEPNLLMKITGICYYYLVTIFTFGQAKVTDHIKRLLRG
jgi:hypothetical protein